MRHPARGDLLDRAWRLTAVALGCLMLANCASSNKLASRVDPRYGVAASPRVVELGQPVPKGGGTYRVGKPYMVGGRLYVPEENRHYRSEGLASWYGEDFHGRLTANGEIFDMESLSAAHPTIPMPSYVRVTNLENRRSVIVRVNDRGPYHADREIDVSLRAAQMLGFHKNGTARVRVEYVAPAPLEGSDERRLVATMREGGPAPAPSGVMLASTRSFLPRAADTPFPPERPFDLGQPAADGRVAAATPRRGTVTASYLPGVAYADVRPAPRPSLAQASGSARASTSSGDALGFGGTPAMSSQAVATGRGLY